MAKVYIALGSNLGDREAYLRQAIQALENYKKIRVTKVSSVYESEPVGGVKQRNFYNMAIEIETALSPRGLLAVCQEVENKLKRERTIHWGPRTIDLDILLYDAQEVNEEDLTIPHKEMTKRAFVLVPLLEIAPRIVLPSGELLSSYLLGLAASSLPLKIGRIGS